MHGSAHSGGELTKYILYCRKWSYFTVGIVGYAIGEKYSWLSYWLVYELFYSPFYNFLSPGLVTAGVIADLFHAAQPALLYLVPGVIIPLFVKSIIQVRSECVCVCVCVRDNYVCALKAGL